MTMAWLFTGYRIRQSNAPVTPPVYLLRQFFLYMAFFFVFMCVPHLWLYFDPYNFPAAMAWGYTVGHIFMYIAFTYTARMFCVIMPRLASKEKLISIIGAIIINAALTIITGATMIYGTQPTYDYQRHITQFNAAPIVGVSIAIFAILTLMPLAILFIVRAFKNHGSQRLRPLLLGSGFIGMTIAGPLHDTAQNWQTFLIADIFTVASILLIGVGIVYRLEQNLATQHTARPAHAS